MIDFYRFQRSTTYAINLKPRQSVPNPEASVRVLALIVLNESKKILSHDEKDRNLKLG